MASNDVRDILDVKVTEARPAKKQKLVVRRPENISKEVFSLIGERMPPVVLQPETEKYQKKFKVTRKAQPWEWQSFANPCRDDGLVLNHWVKKPSVQSTAPETPATPAESRADDAKRSSVRSTGSHWAQYNHKIVIPEYDDELYEAKLKSDDWTREETDYLFQIVKDFDLRWTLIADRYDYQPTERDGDGDSMAVTAAPKARSMEQLKARYYQVASKAIVVKQPPPSMSEQEFEAYERMTKFDPARESTRKRLAEALLARSPEEIKEEETLLSELKRIVANEEKFLQERKELYNRLDYPLAQGSVSAFESSAGLQQLVQNLVHADKSKKRRSLTGTGDNVSSPAQATPGQHTPNLNRPDRASIGGQPTSKKAGAGSSAPRQLSARDEVKFGVSTHERLSSGVAFRSGRIEKLVLAKSTSQSQKLQAVIAELGLALRPNMPTTKVCDEYESLIQNVHKLLEIRKHSEKIANEVKIVTAQKEARLKRERGEEDSSMIDANDAENRGSGEGQEGAKEDSEEDAEGEDEGEMDASAHQATSDNENEDQEGEDNEDAEAANEDGEEEEEEEEEEDDADGEAEDANESDADADAAEDDDGDEVQESEDEDQDDDADLEEEEAAEDTRASIAPSTKSTRSAGMHKRSASVLSLQSEKSTKRQKK